jgi:muramoyltetrapeptide carboxypeptidase
VEFRYPPALVPGDKVAVVAPASPFKAGEFWRGLAWIRDRYQVVASTGILERHGYLAGNDARRARELADAMLQPEVRAILCARGGYGVMRILQGLPWDAFCEHPRWVVGFSDVTALHVMLNTRRIASIHGPHVTGLGREAPPWMRASWTACLERPRRRQRWENLATLHPGRAEGPIVGGNLSLIEAMAATGELQIPLGCVLAIEDVSERPYRIDRMLTSLVAGRHLSRIAGIVCGGLVACDPGNDGVKALDVIFERTRKLGIPVVSGAPFGHGDKNDAFVLGSNALVENGTVTLTGT